MRLEDWRVVNLVPFGYLGMGWCDYGIAGFYTPLTAKEAIGEDTAFGDASGQGNRHLS